MRAVEGPVWPGDDIERWWTVAFDGGVHGRSGKIAKWKRESTRSREVGV
jgi:hypothetical protein